MKVKLEKKKTVDLYALQSRNDYNAVVGIDNNESIIERIIIGGVLIILALIQFS